MKDIFEKEFRSKLKVENEKIYTYIENNKLQMEKIMETYNNYISTIIRNSPLRISVLIAMERGENRKVEIMF